MFLPCNESSLSEAVGAIEQFHILLKQHQRLTQDIVIKVMNEVCSGTAAQGAWDWKQAYNLIEAAFVRLLLTNPEYQDLAGLQALVPHHTVRAERQIELQQFSTPLEIANIVAIAAQVAPTDLVLEPSAGTGILAAFAARTTSQLILNEICPERSDHPQLPISTATHL